MKIVLCGSNRKGGELWGYVAGPKSASAGVVVLHAWWGLTPDFIDVADRLAGEGSRLVAPDLFYGETASTLEAAELLSEEMLSDAMINDVSETVHWLRGECGGARRKIGVVGFSLGGMLALEAGAHGDGDAVVTFYGTTVLQPGGDFQVPVLGHFAERDPYEPEKENIVPLFERLQELQVSATRYDYPGTGHWFFESSNKAYNPVAHHLAWQRTLHFLGESLG
ncbi:MAG: dienelactone hydrolase family protein [Firmicutes bacterium]|nr:dienelactone hydrolase family protein [Bacillota bacterium]